MTASRILAREGITGAFGHVSMRSLERPERFLLSCARSPALVTTEDIIEFDLGSNATDMADSRRPFIERFMHGEIYAARADVGSVIHAHTKALLPFCIAGIPLRAAIPTAAGMGSTAGVWDIRDRFGDTDLLVSTRERGADLARELGRGHSR